jgi:hypothetical protein
LGRWHAHQSKNASALDAMQVLEIIDSVTL